jgi:hypothetical protein
MLDKKRGYASFRPFYTVDPNVQFMAGQVAFLAVNSAGITVATTAASGTIPIGCFWKDRANSVVRTSVERLTFDSTGLATASKGNFIGGVRVVNITGTIIYTEGVDYSVSLPNGTLTALGGLLAAGDIVDVSFTYTPPAGREYWDNVSTQWSKGVNYDRQPDDTLGSGLITVVEGDAIIYTDMYDTAQVYALNDHLQSDAQSRWTTAVGVTSPIGRVVKVPTAADPFLGVAMTRVVV